MTNTEENSMLAFFGGLFLGGIVGVVMMCLVQINRNERDD